MFDYEPYSNAHQDDPYPMYARLRASAPVHYAPESDVWCVSRYDDVQAVLSNSEVFKSKTQGFQQRQLRERGSRLSQLRMAARFMIKTRIPPWKMLNSRMLIMEDGPIHRDMRNTVNRGFTPRRIQAWEKRIRELVDGCMAQAREKQRFDLVEELAIPLPVTVIAEMLGVESQRFLDFKRWSDTIISGATGPAAFGEGGERVAAALGEMRAYLAPIVRDRRASPRDDLVSVLVAAEHADRPLDDHEIFLFFLLLLVAGNETTTNLLGNATDALLDNEDQLAKVVRDPALVKGVVEETLRFDSPVQFISRVTAVDAELRGVSIPANSIVLVMLAAANRDPERFENPDCFDIERDTRGHLGLGFGEHFCLGAALARLEATAALDALIPALPNLERVTPQREFLDSYLIRGRSRLELGPRSAG